MNVAEFIDRARLAPDHEIIVVLPDGSRWRVEYLSDDKWGEPFHVQSTEARLFVQREPLF